jgi:integrase/recombinase XerD
VRLHEKGGKEHDVPCHHHLDQCLHDYIEAAGITDDIDGYLFRTARRKTGQLTTNPLFQQDAHRIIRRRAKAAGIETRIGNHTFRATGITAYLTNSGKLEVAQQIANHESPRTTKLYENQYGFFCLGRGLGGFSNQKQQVPRDQGAKPEKPARQSKD